VEINHLVLIAGGKGTRLATVAAELPKILIPVGGKPLLAHYFELASACNIDRVTIFAGYRASDIQSFVGDGSRFGLQVNIVVEDEPLGTAGALMRSLDALPDDFFVLYGDVMCAVDLQALARFYSRQTADFTLVVHPNDHPSDSDLLEVDDEGRVVALHACPHPADACFGNLVSAALYAVRRDALRPWAGASHKRDFIKDIVPMLLSDGGRVFAYRSNEYLKDMGTPARLQQVEEDYKCGRISPGHAVSRPAVFLDRDGTLNVEKGHLRDPQQLELLPGVGAALRALRGAGFRLVVVTNQPVIARGEASEAQVASIHRRLEWDLGKAGAFVDAIYLCPHHPDRGFPGERASLKVACECRKPGTGLIDKACRDIPIDRASSWVVGDQSSDIEMARRAGLRSILVQTGLAGADKKYDVTPTHVAGNLTEAARMIVSEHVDARR
jgi:histidinol-phosphate phosphatase family protein